MVPRALRDGARPRHRHLRKEDVDRRHLPQQGAPAEAARENHEHLGWRSSQGSHAKGGKEIKALPFLAVAVVDVDVIGVDVDVDFLC